MTASFEFAFARTLGHEGGYSNHPADRGGATKYGITTATWEAYKAEVRPLDRRPVADITVDDAKAVYAREFWQPLGLDHIEDGRLSAEIFDTAVNSGTVPAVTIAQRAANACRVNRFGSTLCAKVKVDGRMGPITRQALNIVARTRLGSLLQVMNTLQGARFVEIVEGDESQAVFLDGWLTRARVG